MGRAASISRLVIPGRTQVVAGGETRAVASSPAFLTHAGAPQGIDALSREQR